MNFYRQDKRILKTILLVFIPLFVIVGCLLLTSVVFAQGITAFNGGTNYGLDQAGAFGLGTTPLVTVIANVVNILLGLLGVIAVLLILYGGFIWMTAAGDPGKVEKAKKILIGAIIGLVIILSAFAIAQFVISMFKQATTCDNPPCGEVCSPEGATASCGPCSSRYCSGGVWTSCMDVSCPPIITEKRFSYIKGFSDPNYPSWTKHSDLGPGFYGTVAIPTSTSLIVRGYARDEEGVVNKMDLYRLVAGSYVLESPFIGIPSASIVDNATTTWNTSGYALYATNSIEIMVSSSNDIYQSERIKTQVWPGHCFNGAKDEDEVQADCGGSCPNCDGDSCAKLGGTACSNDNCSSGLCDIGSCICVTAPHIDYMSPALDVDGNTHTKSDDLPNGATGTMVTIWGKNFGVATGTVVFRRISSSAMMVAPLANCDGAWKPNQIIVVVPAVADIASAVTNDGLVSTTPMNYEVTVEASSSGLTSNAKNFQVNNIIRPGICSMNPGTGVYPATTTVSGNRFPTGSPQNNIWYFEFYEKTSGVWLEDNITSTLATAWTPTSFIDTVPQNKLGLTSVRVYNGSQFSNYYKFIITDGNIGSPCGYDSSVCNEDVSSCKTGLSCFYCPPASTTCDQLKSCTCQPSGPTFCKANSVANCDVGGCAGKMTCNANGSAWGSCVQDDPACVPNLIGQSTCALYSWGFTANRQPQEGDSCGADSWGYCNLNGCSSGQTGLTCDPVGSGEEWLELYNPDSSTTTDIIIEDLVTKSVSSSDSITIQNGFNVINSSTNSGFNLPAHRAKLTIRSHESGEIIDEIVYGNKTGDVAKILSPKSFGRKQDGLDTNQPGDFTIFSSSTQGISNGSATTINHLVINEIALRADPCTCVPAVGVCQPGQRDEDSCPQTSSICKTIKICQSDHTWGACQLDPGCWVPTGSHPTQTIYSWAFTAQHASVYGAPYVVEDCSRFSDCRSGQRLPSPTPWYHDGATVIEGWSSSTNSQIIQPLACTNAIVSARFSKKMNPDSFTTSSAMASGTVKVFRRNGTSWENVAINGFDFMDTAKYTQVTMRTGNLVQSSTYKVILRSGVKSDDNQDLTFTPDSKFSFAQRDCNVGSIGDAIYCWNFNTRTSTAEAVCKEGCPECTPDPTKLYYRLAKTHNYSNLTSNDNVCLMLDPWNYNWTWSTTSPASTLREDITNNNLLGYNSSTGILSTSTTDSFTDPIQTSTALGETIYDSVSSTIVATLPTGKSDFCNVINDFSDPIVMEDQDCHQGTTQSPSPYKGAEDACTNAIISARFSKNMQDASLFDPADNSHPNIIIQDCSTSEANATSTNIASCSDVGSGWKGSVFPYSYSDVSLDELINSGQADDAKPEGFIIVPNSNLTSGHWYRVIIKGGEGGVRGADISSGVEVAKGTLQTPNMPEDYFGQGRNDYFWIFKIGSDKCPIDSVNISPYNNFMKFIGKADIYSAFPQANNCNILKPESYEWNWRSLIDLNDDLMEENTVGGTGINIANICDKYSSTVLCAYDDSLTEFMVRVGGKSEGLVNIKARATGTRATGLPWNNPINGDKWGFGQLQIGSVGFVINHYEPVSSKCDNPSIYIGFNKNASSTSVSPNNNIKLYECEDSACRVSATGSTTVSLVGIYPTGLGTSGASPAMTKDLILAPSTTLATGTTYRVVVKDGSGGVKSINGMELGGLNYRLNGDFGEQCEPGLYPWNVTGVCNDHNTSPYCVISRTTSLCSTKFKECNNFDITATSTDYCDDGCHNTGNTNIGVCGNSKIEPGEDCDDGNIKDGDGCAHNCLLEGISKSDGCGNGIVEGNEQCDLGNDNSDSGTGCSTKCLYRSNYADSGSYFHTNYGFFCGDNIIHSTTTTQGKKTFSFGEICDGSRGCTGDCRHTGTLPLSSGCPNKIYDSFDALPASTASNSDNPFGGVDPNTVYRNVWINNAGGSFPNIWSSMASGGTSNSHSIITGGAVSDGQSAIINNTLTARGDHYRISAEVKFADKDGTSNLDSLGLVFAYESTTSYRLFKWLMVGHGSDSDYNKFAFTSSSVGSDGIIQAKTGNRILNDGNWKKLTVEVVNGTNSAQIKGYVNSNLVLTATTTQRIRGKAGFFVIEPVATTVYFDDLTIENLDTQNKTWCLGYQSDIFTPVCGDGTLEIGEQCDDHNTIGGDGCSSRCLYEGSSVSSSCGNNIVESGQNDSFSWLIDVASDAQTCQDNFDIELNPCPNGIWRLSAAKEITDFTLSIYQGSDTAGSCVSLPKGLNLWQKMTLFLSKLFNTYKEPVSPYWCNVYSKNYNSTDLENIRKGSYASSSASIGAVSTDVLGYPDPNYRYILNYIPNSGFTWATGTEYRVDAVYHVSGGTEASSSASVTIKDDICVINKVMPEAWPKGEIRYNDSFSCVGDACGKLTDDIYDDDMSADWTEGKNGYDIVEGGIYKSGNQHLYRAWARTVENYLIRPETMAWQLSNYAGSEIATSSFASSTYLGNLWVTAGGSSGYSLLKVSANAGGVAASTTVRIDNNSGAFNVTSYGPLASNCINPDIKLGFSTEASSGSAVLNSNIVAYRCASTDSNCEDESYFSAQTTTLTSTYPTGLGTNTPDPLFFKNITISPASPFASNTSYRMIIKGGASGVRAYNGNMLSGLNYSYGTLQGGEECEPGLQPWSDYLGSCNSSSVSPYCVVSSTMDLCNKPTGIKECSNTESGITSDYCNDTCHNTGNANTASCGNGGVELGEDCDDGNTTNGDDCSNICKWEGTGPGLCGNGTIDYGEQCDLGALNGQGYGCLSNCLYSNSYASTSPSGSLFAGLYCGNTAITSTLVAVGGKQVLAVKVCDSVPGCNSSCLHIGSQANAPLCGNGIIEKGEGCDLGLANGTGKGCTNNCLYQGSVNGAVCGNNVIESDKPNSFSWVLKTGKDASECHSVSYNFNPCPNGIWRFTLDKGIVSSTIIIYEGSTTNAFGCIVGEQAGGGFWQKVLATIRLAIMRLLNVDTAVAAPSYCPVSTEFFSSSTLAEIAKGNYRRDLTVASDVGGEIMSYPNTSNNYVLNYIKNNNWSISTDYRIKVQYQFEQGAIQEVNYKLNTLSGTCDIKSVRAEIWPKGEAKGNDTFLCASDRCGKYTDDIYDDDMSAYWTLGQNGYDIQQGGIYLSGNQHLYRVWAMGKPPAAYHDNNNYLLKTSSTDWHMTNIDGTYTVNDVVTSTNYTGDQWVTASSTGGLSRLKIVASSSFAGWASTTVNINTFFCNNPWPEIEIFPFRDSTSTCTVSGSCVNTNFQTYYCRDYGLDRVCVSGANKGKTCKEDTDCVSGRCLTYTADDLPSISGYRTSTASSSWGLFVRPQSGDIIKEFLWAKRPGEIKLASEEVGNKSGDSYNSYYGAVSTSTGYIMFNDDSNYGAVDYQFTVPADGLYYVKLETSNYTNIDDVMYSPALDGFNTECWKSGQVYQTFDVFASQAPASLLETDKKGRIVARASASDSHEINDTGAFYLPQGNNYINIQWLDPCHRSSTPVWASKAVIYNIKLIKYNGSAGNDNDVIGLRVMNNTNHYSPKVWYSQKFVGKPQGALQAIKVDDYQGVMDGGTTYAAATNIVTDIYTNIYLLSYNKGASDVTQNIYKQLLSNWTFNINDLNTNYCVTSDSTAPDNPCWTDGFCQQKYGANSYCLSHKARTARDTRRLADMQDIRKLLFSYAAINRCSNDFARSCPRVGSSTGCFGNGVCGNYFPNLKSGTYVVSNTLSIWPSWVSTLGNSLKTALPVDPINSLGYCSTTYGYNAKTCWNEGKKLMLCPNATSSFFYFYKAVGTGVSSTDFNLQYQGEVNDFGKVFDHALGINKNGTGNIFEAIANIDSFCTSTP
ncbi:MAG: hypothetical protein WC516_02720 [Patescibacteria group bacterium]